MLFSSPPRVQLFGTEELKTTLYVTLMVKRQRFLHERAAAIKRIQVHGLPTLKPDQRVRSRGCNGMGSNLASPQPRTLLNWASMRPWSSSLGYWELVKRTQT